MPIRVSRHARDRMKTRHLSLEVIDDAISQGTRIKDKTLERVRYETDQIVVVLVSPKVRHVVTVWSRMITREQEHDLEVWKRRTFRLRREIRLEITRRFTRSRKARANRR